MVTRYKKLVVQKASLYPGINIWRLYYNKIIAKNHNQSHNNDVYVLIFVDLRFEQHFVPMYIWQASNGLYSKDWQLNIETVVGLLFPARSRVECCIKCHGIAKCTGVDYVSDKLMCHTYGMQNVNLP